MFVDLRINGYFRFEFFCRFLNSSRCPAPGGVRLVTREHHKRIRRKRFLIYPNRMADDSNFVALLNSLLSIDNDARTAAEVSEVAKVKKSIKLR
jgi:hypothetical protein